ncbi:MAG: hypothetical protein ACE5F1_17145, partial [Planctomycetota bacterium]
EAGCVFAARPGPGSRNPRGSRSIAPRFASAWRSPTVGRRNREDAGREGQSAAPRHGGARDAGALPGRRTSREDAGSALGCGPGGAASDHAADRLARREPGAGDPPSAGHGGA